MEKDTSVEEKIYFWTSDKIKLCGILTRPDVQTNKCLILCHGITVDKNEGGIFSGLAQKLADTGFAFFRFDFRGHGESQGYPTEVTIAGEINDIEAAFEYLKGKGFTKFGIISASFAGGPVSFFISKHPEHVKALILWNSLIDYDSHIQGAGTIWRRKYWGKPALERAKKFGFTQIGSRKFKVGLPLIEEVYTLKPWKELLKVEIPTLFIHGDKDTYVPYQDSVKYSQMVKNGGLITVKGAEHGFHDRPEDAETADKATIEFFAKNL